MTRDTSAIPDDGDGLTELDGEAEPDGDADPLGLRLCEPLGLMLDELDGEVLPLGLMLAEPDGEAEPEGLELVEGEPTNSGP